MLRKILYLLAIFAWIQPANAQSVQFGYVQTTLPASGLSGPWQAAKDAAGNIYIADSNNTRVVELPAGGGPQITVPLTGLSDPDAVAVDQNGNLFVGDFGNGSLFELPAGGSQMTVASGLVGPSALAVDALGNLFIADGVDGVFELPAGGGTLKNLFANGSDIFGVAVDASGNVFMADTSKNTILELKSGATSPITLPITGLSSPFGVMVDTAGNIFVADTGHFRLVEYTAGGSLFTIGSGIKEARALSPDGAGGVLVADSFANNVWDFSPAAVNFGSVNVCPGGQSTPAPCSNTLTLNYLVTASGTLGTPQVLAGGVASADYTVASGGTCTGTVTAGHVCTVKVTFAPQLAGSRTGAVQIVDGSSNVLSTVLVYGIGVGPQIAFGPGVQSTVASGLNSPEGVAVDQAGNVFFADAEAAIVYRVPAGGGAPAMVGSGFSKPLGVAVDAAGNVFVADHGVGKVYKLPADGSAPTTVGSGFSEPVGLAVDGAGNVFVSDNGFEKVYKVPAGGGAPTTVGSGFSNSQGVAVDGAGNVFVADGNAGIVYKLPADGGAKTIVASGFGFLTGLAVDAAGDLFVAVQGRVYKLPADGSPKTTVASGFSAPGGVAVDATGNVFVAVFSAAEVIELNLSQPPTLSFAETVVGKTSTDSPQAVTIENIGNAALTETGLTIGTNFAQTAGSGTPADCSASTSLMPGAACNLSISFSPVHAGTLSTTAQLVNNALNGNPATQSITLKGTGDPGPAAAMSANTGTTPQTVAILQPFAALAVTVTDAYSDPLAGVPVNFTAPSTGASGVFSNTLKTISIQTDSNGVATAPFTANATMGGPYNVSAVAGQLSAVFLLTNTVGAPASIAANPGTTPQAVSVNAAFVNLAVTVKDAGGDLLSGVNVVFTAPSTGASGTFSNNSNTITVATVAGIATAPFTANANGGGPYNVTASIGGQPAPNGVPPSTTGPALKAVFMLTNNFLTQSIQNFGTISTQTVGIPLTLTATATSGLTVGYSSATTLSVCTISGSTVTFLMPGSCTITASQGGNNSYSAAPSVPQTFNVIPNVPTISNIQAISVGGNSEVISWTTDQPSTTQVNYGPTSAYGSSSPANNALVTSHSVTLNNLPANTTYNFDVASTNSTAGTATSTNATFTTTPYVGYVAFWGVNNSGVTISWSTDVPANTVVAYGTTMALGQLTTAQPALTNNHGVLLTGLNSGTTYFFQALSTTAGGSTGGSTIYSFTTTGAPASPAPVISNVQVSGVTTTSATVTWTTDQASTSQLMYGTTTSYGTASPVNFSLLVTSHSVTLTGLTPGTTYDFEAVSMNGTGTATGTSSNYTFTTTAVVSSAPTISNIKTSVTSNSATITWTTDQAANSAVKYGTSTSYGLSIGPDSSYVTSHSVTINGLTAGTTYDFAVVSANTAALSSTSPNGTFITTAANATPPFVGYVAFWGVNNSGVTISWSTDVLATTQLAYGTSPALGQTTPVQNALTASHGVVLTGLNSGTTYYFVAQSTGSNGATGSSTTYTFTTTGAPSTPAPTITNVSVQNIGNTSATITWHTDEAASSQVNYGVTAAYTASSTLDPTLLNDHSVTLTNLSPGTTYDFDVMSANSSNISATSPNSTFQTTGSSPGPVISAVSASSVTSGTALITWTTDQASSSQVNYGPTTAYGQSTTPNTTLVTSHSVMLSGLTPNTMYNFAVVSANGSNVSSTSSNFTFTTATTSAAPPVLSFVAFWGVTGSGVTISWSTNVPANTSVAYGTTMNSLGQTSPVQTALTVSHGVTLTGLLPGTTYYFAAQSADVNGNTGYSTTYTFTTIAGAPTISGVTVTPAANHTATINWTTSAPTYSYVQYGSASGSYGRYSAQTSLTATPQCTLPYVPSGTVYYQLVSTDAHGNQVVSPEATFVEP